MEATRSENVLSAIDVSCNRGNAESGVVRNCGHSRVDGGLCGLLVCAEDADSWLGVQRRDKRLAIGAEGRSSDQAIRFRVQAAKGESRSESRVRSVPAALRGFGVLLENAPAGYCHSGLVG